MDKITVMDIVERCDITRGCFYYHFQDIYAVFEEVLRMETERMLAYDNAADSWEENFIAAASFLYWQRGSAAKLQKVSETAGGAQKDDGLQHHD